jgi:outer membrane lipoprotein-sorting protein
MRIGLFLILFFALIDMALASFLPKAFEANLDQVVQSIIKNKEQVTPVKMKYLFANNIYFEVQGDNPVTYVCNAKTTWKYNPPFDSEVDKGEVLIGDSSKYCYVKIFDALSNGLKSNPLYKVELSGKTVNLQFTKDAKAQLNISHVIMTFKNTVKLETTLFDIEKMQVYYLDKKEPITFRFSKIIENQKLSSKDFEFKVPLNTNINRY